MIKPVLKGLADKYTLMTEGVVTEFEQGVQSTAGGDTFEEATPVQPEGLNWQVAGLYEPENLEDQRKVDLAIKDLAAVFKGFESSLNEWQQIYHKQGASDTVSKEQVAQYVAKHILHLVKLDE